MMRLISIFVVLKCVDIVSASKGCINSPASRQCWGDFDINTDYYEVTPTTGRTVEYYLTVDNTTLAPDGIPRQMLVFNNSYPGPLIEANWGDWIVVHVKNNLPYNGTSVHWHGIFMENNAANDGTPGVTQCPIPPGYSFTYRFRATTYGTTWYHSHFTLQYSDGLVGPLVIHGPTSANWDVDLGTVLLQDYFHDPIFGVWFAERVKPDIPPNTGLINGKNKNLTTGTGEFSVFEFVPGQRYRMRLINVSTDMHFKFSIDEHLMTVQAADFVPVVPYTQRVLDIALGQRYDIIVEANQPPGSYWMRAITAIGCADSLNPNSTLAVVSYKNTDPKVLPDSTPYPIKSMECKDETGLIPVLPKNVGNLSPAGQEFNLSVIQDGIIVKFIVNGSSLFIDWDRPTLLMAENQTTLFPREYNLVTLNGTSDTWTYFVVQSVGPIVMNHPMHLHGHDFFVLGEGKGIFSEEDLKKAHMINPTRRDVKTMPMSDEATGDNIGGFIIIAFRLNNPGTWLLHCHIAWHISAGLGIQFVERAAEIPGNVGLTQQWDDTCKAWGAYQSAAHPPRDDSGL